MLNKHAHQQEGGQISGRCFVARFQKTGEEAPRYSHRRSVAGVAGTAGSSPGTLRVGWDWREQAMAAIGAAMALGGGGGGGGGVHEQCVSQVRSGRLVYRYFAESNILVFLGFSLFSACSSPFPCSTFDVIR